MRLPLARPPWHVWLAAGLAALLRAVPFAWTRLVQAPAGTVSLPIGSNPRDWLAYVALVRQHPVPGTPFLANPFTTEPQSGRFVLLVHELLNAVHRVTGLDPFWLLELSRIPLLLAFFAVLWSFLRVVLPTDRERGWAVWLVALSGGVEYLAVEAAGWLPEPVAGVVRQDLWFLYGWNSFAAFYNPVWVASLALLLVVLLPALRPDGRPGKAGLATIAVGIFVLWLVHPYSAMMAVAIVPSALLLRAWVGDEPEPRPAGAVLAALFLSLLGIAAVSAWQLQDEVFRRSSGGALGAQEASVFWYPLSLGAVGIFALRGWGIWIRERRPWRFAIGGWTMAVLLLHASPVLNGYHFVMYLYPPVCIVAATALARWQDRVAGSPQRRAWWAGVGALLFASALAVTLASIAEIRASRLPVETSRLLADLSASPPGNVLAPPDLGNLVPAFQDHRVFVGHWFMTPDFAERSRLYEELMEAPERRSADLLRLVDAQRIDYLVAPTGSAPAVARVVGGRLRSSTPYGSLTLLRLTGPSGRPD